MATDEQCSHPVVSFQEGDYQISCRKCHMYWTLSPTKIADHKPNNSLTDTLRADTDWVANHNASCSGCGVCFTLL